MWSRNYLVVGVLPSYAQQKSFEGAFVMTFGGFLSFIWDLIFLFMTTRCSFLKCLILGKFSLFLKFEYLYGPEKTSANFQGTKKRRSHGQKEDIWSILEGRQVDNLDVNGRVAI